MENQNIFARIGTGVVSFFVGLSAFFVFKLIFMVPINLALFKSATEDSRGLLEGVGAILFILAIYLAVKYTKKLNENGTFKSRNIKRVLTVIAGIISMFISTVFLTYYR